MTTQEVPGLRTVALAHPARPLLRRDRTLVGVLVVLAFLLRVPNIGRAYWIDEGISVGIASHPVGQIPGLLRLDGSPPLFYVVLHFWMRVFGTGPIGTHLLPLLVSLGAVPLAYWAGRELLDRRAGLAAAALMATNPFLAWYSTETRMYPIVVVLAMVGLVFAGRAMRARAWRDIAAAVAAFTALLYTHNWGVYLFAATAVVLGVVAWARRDRPLALGVTGAAAAVLLLWLPWAPTLIDQAGNTAAPWAINPNIGFFFADQATALGGTLGIVVAPLLFGATLVINRGRAARQGDVARLLSTAGEGEVARLLGTAGQGEVARLLGTVGILTALFGWLAAQLEPSWTVRYLAVIVAPFLLAAAAALAWNRAGRAVITATCVLLVGWSVIGTLLPNANATYAKSNVAAVARAASPDLSAGDVVVVTQTEQLAVLAHYLPKGLTYVTPTGPVPDPDVVDWRNIVSRLNQAQPCAAVNPLISTLPFGAHVLEVNPVRQLGAKHSAWYRAVNGQIAAVDRLLATDPSLRAVSSYAQAEEPRPYAPVVGELFERVPGASPCR